MKNPYFQTPDGLISIWHSKRLDLIRQVPDRSVRLLLEDPPYYAVKKAAWDNQWAAPADYLDWLDRHLAESQRVLALNGSLYLFASPQMSARVERLVSKRFHVLNNIRWYKSTGWHKKSKKDELRRFLTPWESIIFAEHYHSDNLAKGEMINDLTGFVFEPIRAYLAEEWKRAGLSYSEANAACNTASMAARHFFSRSQWCLPTAEHYEALQKYANLHGIGREGFLSKDYVYLKQEYEQLKTKYEELRRPFNASTDVAHTDKWHFATVRAGQGRHECEKPKALIWHIINMSSNPGDLVFDGFMGSGSTLKAAWDLGRQGWGCDMNLDFCEIAKNQFNQKALF